MCLVLNVDHYYGLIGKQLFLLFRMDLITISKGCRTLSNNVIATKFKLFEETNFPGIDKQTQILNV